MHLTDETHTYVTTRRIAQTDAPRNRHTYNMPQAVSLKNTHTHTGIQNHDLQHSYTDVCKHLKISRFHILTERGVIGRKTFYTVYRYFSDAYTDTHTHASA